MTSHQSVHVCTQQCSMLDIEDVRCDDQCTISICIFIITKKNNTNLKVKDNNWQSISKPMSTNEFKLDSNNHCVHFPTTKLILAIRKQLGLCWLIPWYSPILPRLRLFQITNDASQLHATQCSFSTFYISEIILIYTHTTRFSIFCILKYY